MSDEAIRHATDPVSGKTVEIRNDLTKRLRGEYAVGPTLPNGEPEFGWRRFAEPPSIQLEASAAIETLTAERDALRKTLEWIRNVANSTYENDPKLRADAARTLKRIAERADDALAVGGAS